MGYTREQLISECNVRANPYYKVKRKRNKADTLSIPGRRASMLRRLATRKERKRWLRMTSMERRAFDRGIVKRLTKTVLGRRDGE